VPQFGAGEPAGCQASSVLLFVDSLLQCSLDAGVVVTDASRPEVCLSILLSLGGALTNGYWNCHGEH
jgi:hypothetical protein